MKFSLSSLFQASLIALIFPAIFAQESLIAEGEELILVSSIFEFTEGPARDSEGNIYFTDQPNDRIYKWIASTNEIVLFMEGTGRSNGLYLDNDGALLTCADENSELWKIEMDRQVEVLVENFKGKRLNGPNDLFVDENGGIYFTDPFYKRDYWEHTEPEIKEERVYYLSPNRENLSIAATGFKRPNGIIGTPDGKTLYIADINDNKTYSYRIATNGKLEDKKLFTQLGSDGMTIDEHGNVYLTGDGVSIFNRDGERIGHIPIDRDWTANVTFGGGDNQTLFITAMDSVFTLKMNVKGGHR